MNRIILAVVFFLFVQLAKSQLPSQACIDAQTALATNTACTAALGSGTNFSAICMGSCRTLFDNIIDNCDNAVSCYRAIVSHGCTAYWVATYIMSPNFYHLLYRLLLHIQL